MEVLRLAALVLLSSFVLLALLVGVQLLTSLSSEASAEEVLLSLREALEVLKATGNPQTVDLDLPEGQALFFENERAELAGKNLEMGYPVREAGPFTGRCRLELRLENGPSGWEVVVREV